MLTISKTDYMIYRECRKDAWFKVHQPELYFSKELSEFAKALIETGNEVELEARKLFPDGVLLTDRKEAGRKETQEHLQKGTPTLFQAVFSKDGFFAAVDVLQKNADVNTYVISEIKATNETKTKEHLPDLAFQVCLLQKFGLEFSRMNIIHLNNEYVRSGDLVLSQLFTIEDVTDQVLELLPIVKLDMDQALTYLSAEVEPAGACDCVYKGRSGHCTMFRHINTHIPEYSVHDISRIGNSKKKLTDLIDSGVYTLDEIPVDFSLTDNQRNQVDVYKAGRAMVNPISIAEELDKLIYPLYFLDYETYPCAVPRFDGFSPYNQIPFQYSLHILESPEAEPSHKDFLYEGTNDPSPDLFAALSRDIGPVGSVLVWNKKFEQGINQQLASRLPAAAPFMSDVNSRVYDLMDIFTAQLYVHPGFKGKTSIKNVLPTLVPELSYKELNIKEGGTASQRWNQIATNRATEAEKRQIVSDLKTYCGLDTYAMYVIWKHLYNL